MTFSTQKVHWYYNTRSLYQLGIYVIKKHDPKALPLNKSFMTRTLKNSTNTPAIDPSTSFKSTITKKHDLKALPLDKSSMSWTLKTSTSILALDPSTSFKSIVTNKHNPKALPLDKCFMSRTLNTKTCKPTITKNHDLPSSYKSTIEDVEELCKGNEDPKEQVEHSKEMETKVPWRRKQVWKPGGNVHW